MILGVHGYIHIQMTLATFKPRIRTRRKMVIVKRPQMSRIVIIACVMMSSLKKSWENVPVHHSVCRLVSFVAHAPGDGENSLSLLNQIYYIAAGASNTPMVGIKCNRLGMPLPNPNSYSGVGFPSCKLVRGRFKPGSHRLALGGPRASHHPSSQAVKAVMISMYSRR